MHFRACPSDAIDILQRIRLPWRRYPRCLYSTVRANLTRGTTEIYFPPLMFLLFSDKTQYSSDHISHHKFSGLRRYQSFPNLLNPLYQSCRLDRSAWLCLHFCYHAAEQVCSCQGARARVAYLTSPEKSRPKFSASDLACFSRT